MGSSAGIYTFVLRDPHIMGSLKLQDSQERENKCKMSFPEVLVRANVIELGTQF